MKNLTLKEIIEVTKGELIQGNLETICQNFSKDTRTIQKGDTYIAIKGEKFDGNLFWKQALEKGANCIIVSEISYHPKDLENYQDRAIIKVKDTLKALYEIAKLKRSFYSIPVIAITGSVGKTSTKDMVANVVSQKFKTLKTVGNNNNNIGLPFTILKLQDEEAMVLEMGMNHFGEISLLTNIAKPDICIITNIGTSHIGNLGSRQNILKAKLEILEGTKNPTIIINNDNDLLHKWQEENKDKRNIITYGIGETSDIHATDIFLKGEESEFNCQLEKDNIKFEVPVGGRHFILNALCAISVGKTLEIENAKIKKGIEEFELTKKRMDITNLQSGVKIINDAYNASLESMQASLKYLSEFKNHRKIAVLGDMLELGDYSQKLHEQVGEAVYQNEIDVLITSGKEAKYIVKKAKELGMSKNNIYYLETKQEIMQLLKQIMKTGDIILLKASNGMKFFEIAEEIQKNF
ncbi:MAG: UDP-N-acetylmuramoyl-tripeptide--D-alanyl-D-alanine ligase [Clostridia bacterium]|nr:UDP-N-acetylmuramoyl-tripeptide--D-alanyl-D-alanine ligase [Clostridia bacterium]